MSTSLRRTVVKTNEGKAVEQDRPGDYPGEGPVTDDERRQWYLESRAILSELLGKQGEAGGDALVYYVAGGVWSSPPFPDLADPEKAAGYFAEYVRRAPALHSNFLSRAWAADRANKLANRKLVDTDLFDTDDHIIRCIRERSLSGQLISQAAAVQSLKTLIQNHPPVSLWLDGGEIRLGLSQDAAPVDAGDLQTAAERLRMKVVQGADRDEIVLQRTGATDDGLSDPLVQNRVVRQLGTPTPADPDAAERDLRGLAGGLRLAESLRIENIGKRRQYRLFDATELRLRYTAPDQTHFGFVQGIVERNPLLIPGSQILKLQPDGTYGVEMQVFVLDLFDPGPL